MITITVTFMFHILLALWQSSYIKLTFRLFYFKNVILWNGDVYLFAIFV